MPARKYPKFYKGNSVSETNMAYRGQKAIAKKRSIPFRFEFWDWINWWEEQLGPDWFQLRGCYKGQHQMARNGDIGAYERGNVQCKTVSQNRAETVANGTSNYGERNACHKLTEKQVLAIYHSKEKCRAVAQRYNISEKYVSSIRCCERWRHLTLRLPRRGSF